jgi:GNAT superfamily N-acetyltransferase
MFTNIELARREEAREVRYAREIMILAKEHDPECAGYGAEYTIEELGSGCMFHGGAGYLWNRAMGMGLDGPVSDADLDRIVAFYAERGGPAQVLFASYAHASLLRGLSARGFGIRDVRHVFFRRLSPGDDLRAGRLHGLPEGLVIETVDPGDPRAVHDYAEMSSSGFRPPDTAMTPVELRFNRDILRHPECTAFVVRDRDQIVASCAVGMDSDIATLWGASVSPPYRNRGIQTALMIMRMERARAHGCQVALVQNLPGIATERNALRLGFSLAYARVCAARVNVT